MVYEGKPSQGCGTCRKRRIKCDQQRPTCGQCIKSKRECQGYRDPSELMFVSENRFLKAKAAGKKGKRIAISQRSSSSSERESASSTIPGSIAENTERQALTYFFNEFVMIPRHQEASRGYIEHLLIIYSDARKGSPLFDATAAAALASFSRKRGTRKLMLQSHIYYGHAVSSLQEAVADPALARANETLMSIMVLGLFEAMVASEDTLFEWGHHADGAAALVNYRGEEMFADAISRKLYWAVKAQAAMNHIVKGEGLDPFPDWENLWKDDLTKIHENHAIKLTNLLTRVPAIRAGGLKWLRCPMSGETALKIVELMGNAKVLDQLLAVWSFETPTAWRPCKVGTSEGILTDIQNMPVYPGNIDSYCDIFVSSIWNHWRAMRIVLQSTILCCLERLFPAPELHRVSEYQQAVSTLGNMTDSICASVPYHLGLPMPRFGEVETVLPASRVQDITRDDWAQPLYRPDENEKDFETKAMGAYHLVWPLFVAYGVITIPDEQREWIQGRLVHIGELHAAGQAQVLANLCKTANRDGREETMTDYNPPPFKPYLEISDILRSRSFKNVEAIADLQARTPEAHMYRKWRRSFLDRLLSLTPYVGQQQQRAGLPPERPKRKRSDSDVGEKRANAGLRPGLHSFELYF